MGKILHYFFIDKEIVLHEIIKSMNLAKVSYIGDKELFFVDINFVFTECKRAESSLSIRVLKGNV